MRKTSEVDHNPHLMLEECNHAHAQLFMPDLNIAHAGPTYVPFIKSLVAAAVDAASWLGGFQLPLGYSHIQIRSLIHAES